MKVTFVLSMLVASAAAYDNSGVCVTDCASCNAGTTAAPLFYKKESNEAADGSAGTASATESKCVAQTAATCGGRSTANYLCPTTGDCVAACSSCTGYKTNPSGSAEKICVANTAATCHADSGKFFCPSTKACLVKGDNACNACPGYHVEPMQPLVTDDALVASIISNVSACTDNSTVGSALATTTSGNGTGLTLKLGCASTKINQIDAVVSNAKGYAVGDYVTVSKSLINGASGSTSDLVIMLQDGDRTASNATLDGGNICLKQSGANCLARGQMFCPSTGECVGGLKRQTDGTAHSFKAVAVTGQLEANGTTIKACTQGDNNFVPTTSTKGNSEGARSTAAGGTGLKVFATCDGNNVFTHLNLVHPGSGYKPGMTVTIDKTNITGAASSGQNVVWPLVDADFNPGCNAACPGYALEGTGADAANNVCLETTAAHCAAGVVKVVLTSDALDNTTGDDTAWQGSSMVNGVFNRLPATSGSGKGMVLRHTISGTNADQIDVLARGTGYAVGDTLTITANDGTGAGSLGVSAFGGNVAARVIKLVAADMNDITADGTAPMFFCPSTKTCMIHDAAGCSAGTGNDGSTGTNANFNAASTASGCPGYRKDFGSGAVGTITASNAACTEETAATCAARNTKAFFCPSTKTCVAHAGTNGVDSCANCAMYELQTNTVAAAGDITSSNNTCTGSTEATCGALNTPKYWCGHIPSATASPAGTTAPGIFAALAAAVAFALRM